ncbi:hypothetical protein B0H19DRAFT_1263778 [Mycena capillaripes]|nr:hypothetical protein B0H19DRAFT_1263778 [Mycena capillaripes]
MGHGNASTSTVPQKRKLGMGGAGGGASGGKARWEEDGGLDHRRDGEKMGLGIGMEGAEESNEIRFRCGSSLDDRFSIAMRAGGSAMLSALRFRRRACPRSKSVGCARLGIIW